MAASAAADLLRWLDANSTSQVMEQVESCLFTGTGWHSSAAAVPVSLQVDASALMCDEPEVAMAVMHNPREVASGAQALINQQLARQAAAAATGDDTDLEPPPSVRLSLQLTQVPLPLSSPSDVQQQAVQLSNRPTAPSSGLLVSMLGVVCGMSAAYDVTYSGRYCCPACGATSDLLAHEAHLPCCNLPKNSAQEDLTGRVMVPAQQLWVTGLSRATGCCSYGISTSPLLVHMPEQQVNSASLGAVVHVIGHAIQNVPNAHGTACTIQVHANNVQPVVPHMLWALPPASTPSITSRHQQQPLHTLWELLGTALGLPQQGTQPALDPHLALTLLLSAAAVGGKARQQDPGAADQVAVLVLHEGFSPATPRLLKQAAQLLSPQSVAVGVPQLAEHVNPITSSSSEGDDVASGKPVFASILHLANSGIAVADLPTMPSKAKQQLLGALQQRATLPLKNVPQQLPIPLTATCWATIAWQDMPGEGDCYAKPTSKAAAAAAAASSVAQAFDVVVADGTVHEDQLYWMLDETASSTAEQLLQQQTEAEAAAALRHLVAGAASCTAPVLSAASQAFLGQYFLVLRQSLGSTSRVSKPVLLASLMRIASGVARLHHRSHVEEPDAGLAVLLMDHTLANKLGDIYRPVLELPCDLNPCSGRSLDEQVLLLHDIITMTFRQYCGTDEEVDMGCADGHENSGCSGM